MSARTMWESIALRRLVGWARRLAGRGAVLLSRTAACVLRRFRVSALWDAAARPFRIVAAVLLGMGYAPFLLTVVGALGAFVAGLAKARPALSEMETPVLLGPSVLIPTIGLTIGYWAIGIGGIVGFACAVTDSALGLGLEWSLVGALGVGLGAWIASAPTQVLIAGALGGGLVGGSVGLLTWLCCTHRTHGPLTTRWAAGAVLALALLAAFTAWTFSASAIGTVSSLAP
ncbi:MAG: hypothetical protein JXA09_12895 [Anaerolineae bacterium]|nr:hypothetical protein [Anaerolineae bacterium]